MSDDEDDSLVDVESVEDLSALKALYQELVDEKADQIAELDAENQQKMQELDQALSDYEDRINLLDSDLDRLEAKREVLDIASSEDEHLYESDVPEDLTELEVKAILNMPGDPEERLEDVQQKISEQEAEIESIRQEAQEHQENVREEINEIREELRRLKGRKQEYEEVLEKAEELEDD